MFQGFKKGLLPVRPDAVQAALDKHRMCLTKDPSISTELATHVRRIAKSVTAQLRLKLGSSHCQSTSSTTEFSYASGGNIGGCAFLKYCPKKSKNVLPLVGTPELLGFVMERNIRGKRIPIYDCGRVGDREKVFSVVAYKRWAHEITPVYFFNPLFYEDMREEVRSKRGAIFQTSAGELNPAIYNDPVVNPACILEPMKVRIITKPDFGIHTDLHKFQKMVWKALYEHKSGFFQLIGEPLQRQHLWKIVAGWQPGEKFCSGDFSAATDNLKGEVSKIILEDIFSQFRLTHPIEYQNIMNSMLKSTVEVPRDALGRVIGMPHYDGFWKNFGYDLPTFQQKNGQLMGNVISFGILCIANYIAYHRSIELAQGRELRAFSARIPHVLINGDDILFKTNDQRYKIWLDTVKEFGLEPSVGKNFISDRFLQVNSELYRVDTFLDGFQSGVRDLRVVPYVNFGLLTGRNKKDCSKDYSICNLSLGAAFSACWVLNKQIRGSAQTFVDSDELIRLQQTAEQGIFARFLNNEGLEGFPELGEFVGGIPNGMIDADKSFLERLAKVEKRFIHFQSDVEQRIQNILGRLRVIPSVISKLTGGLCDKILCRLNPLIDYHVNGLLENVGIFNPYAPRSHFTNSLSFGGPMFRQDIYEELFPTDIIMSGLELEPFHEQSSKLERGRVTVGIDRRRDDFINQFKRTGGLNLIEPDFVPEMEPRFVKI
jgi:hypothetical protein